MFRHGLIVYQIKIGVLGMHLTRAGFCEPVDIVDLVRGRGNGCNKDQTLAGDISDEEVASQTANANKKYYKTPVDKRNCGCYNSYSFSLMNKCSQVNSYQITHLWRVIWTRVCGFC